MFELEIKLNLFDFGVPDKLSKTIDEFSEGPPSDIVTKS